MAVTTVRASLVGMNITASHLMTPSAGCRCVPTLLRESDNRHDGNAIAVMSSGQVIGHVDRDAASATKGSALPTLPTLQERVLAWYDSQPEISRVRRYSMVELERALGTQGRFLSPVLHGLGWKRDRLWSSTGPN